MGPAPPAPDLLPDEDVARSYARGDRAALEALWECHMAELRAVIGKCLRVYPKEDADEQMQQVYVQLLKNHTKYAPDKGRWAAWASTIARNLCKDFIRKQRRTPRHVPLDMPIVAKPERADEDGLAADCDAALASLKENDRWVFIEHYLKGRKGIEIAADLEISSASVSRALERASAAVRGYLTEHGWGNAQ